VLWASGILTFGVLDVGTTVFALSIGLHEGNPHLQFFNRMSPFSVFIVGSGIKVSLLLGVHLLLTRLTWALPRINTYVNYAFPLYVNILGGVVVYSNIIAILTTLGHI
jgi:hypothetical protein